MSNDRIDRREQKHEYRTTVNESGPIRCYFARPIVELDYEDAYVAQVATQR